MTTLTFSTKIKQTRKEAKITQKDLAKKIGVTQSYLSMLEKGTRIPSLKILLELEESLQCNLSSYINEFGLNHDSQTATTLPNEANIISLQHFDMKVECSFEGDNIANAIIQKAMQDAVMEILNNESSKTLISQKVNASVREYISEQTELIHTMKNRYSLV